MTTGVFRGEKYVAPSDSAGPKIGE